MDLDEVRGDLGLPPLLDFTRNELRYWGLRHYIAEDQAERQELAARTEEFYAREQDEWAQVSRQRLARRRR